MAASKRYRAAVVGGTGYGGAELIRRLLLHPDVQLARVASVDHVGEPLGVAHPSLEHVTDLVFEDLAPGRAAEGMDVVLLGLPHKVSSQKMPELVASGARVVDMSGDFRLKDAAAYERHYGQAHPHPELLERFVYGLPELQRERLRGARHIASPGCFATCIELSLLPLAAAGLAPPPTSRSRRSSSAPIGSPRTARTIRRDRSRGPPTRSRRRVPRPHRRTPRTRQGCRSST